MEWQQIIGFYHVARLNSFTKAAQATFRTQSALSQQIKSLETELDCLLFERIGKRKLKLTHEGRILFAFAQKVTREHSTVIDELNAARQVYTGNLTIAAPFTTLLHLLPPVIDAFRSKFPQVKPKLFDQRWQQTVESIKSGEVDFGFAQESVVPNDLKKLRWHPIETVLLVPNGSPLTQLKRVTLEQILDYPLILPSEGLNRPIRKMVDTHFEKYGKEQNIFMESSNVELSAAYVERGLGICFASIVRGKTPLKKQNVKMIPLKHYFKSDHIVVVMRHDLHLSEYKRVFLDLLIKE